MTTFVYVLATCFLFTEAYRPPIKVFEISKTRHQDSRVDAQYYDPEPNTIDRNSKKNPNVLAHYIINSLQGENDDDYKYGDKTRNLPVLILPDDQTVYRKKPTNYSLLHKLLHSALRTNDAEDRTAAPRHRGNYDTNDYY